MLSRENPTKIAAFSLKDSSRLEVEQQRLQVVSAVLAHVGAVVATRLGTRWAVHSGSRDLHKLWPCLAVQWTPLTLIGDTIIIHM